MEKKKISIGNKTILIRSNESTRELLKRAYELASCGYDVSFTNEAGQLKLRCDILVPNETEKS